MTEKVKSLYAYYPIEAFALSMVLFSCGMKEAMITGIVVVFGDILLHVLHENINLSYKQAISAIGLVITTTAFYYSFLYAGLNIDAKTVLAFAAISVLLVKHHEDGIEDVPDYNKTLLTDSIVYLLMGLLAVIREFLSKGEIFEMKLAKWGIMSHSYEKTMFALIFTGIIIAVLNAILHTPCKKNAAVWVCIPVILIDAPFIWNNVPEVIGYIVGVIFILIVYFTFRKYLVLSKISDNFKGIPVELMTLGMMYMIFSIL